MQISKQSFAEFKELMKKHFGAETINQMTEEELYEKAIKLIRFVEIVETPTNTDNK